MKVSGEYFQKDFGEIISRLDTGCIMSSLDLQNTQHIRNGSDSAGRRVSVSENIFANAKKLFCNVWRKIFCARIIGMIY